MFDMVRKDMEWGSETLTLETGRLARQADGSVLATYGESCVHAAVVAERTAREDVDFFPLTVHYLEKYYAAGKIPGGFFKREARPTEKEVLTSRLIDRPIRPLFPKHFRNETQIICTVLSHDGENDPDILAMIAASAALTLSGIPFMGPTGAARVGLCDGAFQLNPKLHEMDDSRLDLVVAGTRDAVMMVESEAQELSEPEMLDAVRFGHRELGRVIDFISAFAQEAAREPWPLPETDGGAIRDAVRAATQDGLREAYSIVDKKARQEAIANVREGLDNTLCATGGGTVADYNPVALQDALKEVEMEILRGRILNEGKRIDGRDMRTVRPISCEVGLLPRTHGSALFTRGETQAMVVATLGTGDDEQIIDALEGQSRERFLLHYNFPSYSVGEVRRLAPPGRREIGHGKLAWRALRPVLPGAVEFPYTIRLVSEIMESNGSSSMATVCGASLAMMDAGIPLRRPVAGVAMGLVLEGERNAILTDILGDEDHLGDMDFKVAGTEKGITSLQMDIKVAGITDAIMQEALAQAHEARRHILDEMGKALSEGRTEFSAHAPRIESITIPTEKIRDVIGTGGKVIRGLVEETGAKIDVSDDGVIKIASPDLQCIALAKKRIHELTAEPEAGVIYDGTVVKVLDFGAFVNFFGPRDGLVHISQMTWERGSRPSEIVREGQAVKVKLLGFDERGKVRLGMKMVDQETGEEIRRHRTG